MPGTIPGSLVVIMCFFAQVQNAPPGDTFLEAFQKSQVAIIEKENSAWKTRERISTEEVAVWRKELGQMLGIPAPVTRTPLQVERRGTLKTANFQVEKIIFQSLPGLYVTGNLYLPNEIAKPAPAVLYVCGHGNSFEEVVIEGRKEKRSLGSKVFYRHHGARLATMGYVCLVIDTLQLGEIEAIHHGTYNKGMFWWQSMGYTPAGVECLNGIRAIDLLQSLQEVDPERIGVTGRSGGGATTWWIAAMDTRVKCAIGVAGLSDLRGHLIAGEQDRFNQGVITGHCDCMFMVNTHRFDFSRVGELCAPRPAMLINTDEDPIFPVGGFRRPTKEIADFYDKMGHPEHFSVYQGKGGHVDTDELQQAAFNWLETWLRPGQSPRKLPPIVEIPEWSLRVLDGKPKNEKNTTAHDWFWKANKTSQTRDEIDLGSLREFLTQTISLKLFEGAKSSPRLVKNTQKSEILSRNEIEAWDVLLGNVVVAQVWKMKGKNQPSETIQLGQDQDDAIKALASTNSDLRVDAVLFLPGKGPMVFSDKRSIDKGDYQTQRRLALLGTTIAGLQTRALLEICPSLLKSGGTLKADGDLAMVAATAKVLVMENKPVLNLGQFPKTWKEAPPMLRLGLIAEPGDILRLALDAPTN